MRHLMRHLIRHPIICSAAIAAGALAALLLAAGTFILILAVREDGRRSLAPVLSPYPDGHDFAFTVVDDTDMGTVENLRPIYDLLDRFGLRVTKTVWVFDGEPSVYSIVDNNGDSLERPEYLEFVLGLHEKGHEIALHTAAPGTDDRARTIAGYDRFREIFGADPKMNVMHYRDREDLYWGLPWASPSTVAVFHDPGLDALLRRIRRPPPPGEASSRYTGDDPSSPLFWGDICLERTTYVRGPVTDDIDTLREFPEIPYHDPEKPFVRLFFAGSMGEHGRTFPGLISPQNIRRLERERGACIAYTHFGMWYHTVRDGRWVVVPSLEENLRFLASRDGWFVPASPLLDRIRATRETFVAVAGDRVLVANRSEIDLPGATLLVRPGAAYDDGAGRRLVANDQGELLIGELARGAEVILRDIDPPAAKPIYWRDANRLRFLLDLERILAKIARLFPAAAGGGILIALAAVLFFLARRRRRVVRKQADRAES
ncbi:MAG: hypothetical protein JXP34_13670 [Planctomycetes bacterium]|nr:hypothetical protein [Planctomycetota bacterium]